MKKVIVHRKRELTADDVIMGEIISKSRDAITIGHYVNFQRLSNLIIFNCTLHILTFDYNSNLCNKFIPLKVCIM